MALTDPEEFWPIIEREIQARSFFLYCESPAAEASPWVQREREAVEAARRGHPKRVGRIRVDQPEIDQASLDEFLSKTRVFLSFAQQDRDAVAPFMDVLNTVGFSIAADLSNFTDFTPGDLVLQELQHAAAEGWVVAFLSDASLQNRWVQREISYAMALGAKFVPVLLDRIELPPLLARLQTIDGFSQPATAPAELAKVLLSRL